MKCQKCGTKVVKFPLFEGEGEDRKFLWKNLFKMDWPSFIFLVVVIMMALFYKHDIAACKEMVKDPCGYCKNTNCCEYLCSEAIYNPQPLYQQQNYSYGSIK